MTHVTEKFYNIIFGRVISRRAGFELTTLVMIGTDCIGRNKSNCKKKKKIKRKINKQIIMIGITSRTFF